MNHALLGVRAVDSVLSLNSASSEAKASDVATGEERASNPDGVAAAEGVGAGDEAGALLAVLDDEVVVGVEGEAGALGVLDGGLGAGGVAELALAHAGAVHEGLLRGLGRVEEELALGGEEEGGRVGLAGARGALGGGVDGEAGLLGLDGGVLEVGARADGHQAEDLASLDGGGNIGLGDGRGRDESSGGGGDESGGELHVDGVVEVGCWFVGGVLSIKY